jgi:hypothetical protein
VDSVNGSDSNPGTLASPWQTIAKVNSTALLPGQSVGFMSGDVWREQLTVSSSGAAGNPITFTSYGSGPPPIISGASVVSSWTSTSPYYASYSTAPNQVFRNGVRLNQVSAQSDLVAGSWWLDTIDSRIYVYDSPSGNTMEASQRTYGVVAPCAELSYVNISNLQIQEAQYKGLYVCGVPGTQVNNVISQNNYDEGIRFDAVINGSITYSTSAYNGNNGIDFYNSPSLFIDHDVAHDNVELPNLYAAGIKGSDGGRGSANVTIQNSISYSNGTKQPGQNTGSGIWVDTIGTGAIIRDNIIYSNNISGINVDADNNESVYYNLSYNNGGDGIMVYADGASSMTGNLVYNNTVWNNQGVGIQLEGPSAGSTANGCTNNQVINNIATNTVGGPNLAAFFGCENPGADGSGNVYTYNAFGVAATSFMWWGVNSSEYSVYYSTYSSWEAATGNCGTAGCSNSIQQNPLLNNPSDGDFTLQAGSPAIGAGVYIPGVSTANPPNIGAK